MYQNFYHLKKEPFHITPDPEFLFLSPSHKQALGSVIYGVKNRKGFILITGEVGVGKTTILRTYLEDVAKQKTKIIYIFNSSVSFQSLLKTIYKELGLDAKTDDVVGMLNDLYQVLMEEYKHGNTVLLIVDEAQNMPVETLENLRMLSNLETSKEKLLQIVLTGQPEFEKMLNLHELRQLKQRLVIRSTIVPFTPAESIAYIKYRLSKVALDEDPVFTNGAMKRIVREAKGIPRSLNILCDNALINGFGYKIRPVSAKVVKETIGDFKGKEKPSIMKWVVTPAALLFFVAGFFLIYSYGGLILSGVKNLTTPPKTVVSRAENPDSSRTTLADPVKEEVQEVKPSIEEPEISQPDPSPVASDPVPTQVVKTVRKGDNLYKLTRKVYGQADNKLVAWVKKNNPSIKDINNIPVGIEIVFPKFKEE